MNAQFCRSVPQLSTIDSQLSHVELAVDSQQFLATGLMARFLFVTMEIRAWSRRASFFWEAPRRIWFAGSRNLWPVEWPSWICRDFRSPRWKPATKTASGSGEVFRALIWPRERPRAWPGGRIYPHFYREGFCLFGLGGHSFQFGTSVADDGPLPRTGAECFGTWPLAG